MEINIYLRLKLSCNNTLLMMGHQVCPPYHIIRSTYFDYYLFHVVLSGEGIYKTKKRDYHIKAGQGFLIYPHTIGSYRPNPKNPWEYVWVAILGNEIESFLNKTTINKENPVFNFEGDCSLRSFCIQVHQKNNLSILEELESKSIYYSFIRTLIKNNTDSLNLQKEGLSYTSKTIQFIEFNYHKKITVSQIALHLSLHPSYLNSVFKKRTGITIKEYLTTLRLDKASKLLTNTNLSISQISLAVGYEDQLQFSKIFKKHKDHNPSQYRKKHLQKRES